ncbi:MAG: NYN domain-containing protein [Nocardioides sp.]
MEPKPRIALLIDADNAPARQLTTVLDDLARIGECNIRRAYGNWDAPNLKGWKDSLHGNAIRPIQQYALTVAKNASDMALVVDAVDLLHRDRPSGFAIVSSDSDFTPLVMYLRERGVDVYGYGNRNTPEAFSSACSKFLFLDGPVGETPDENEVAEVVTVTPRPRKTKTELRQDTALLRLLRGAIAATSDETGWSRASAIGQHISNQSPFDARNFGYPRLTDLMRATELFDCREDGTPAIAFKDKRQTKST